MTMLAALPTETPPPETTLARLSTTFDLLVPLLSTPRPLIYP